MRITRGIAVLGLLSAVGMVYAAQQVYTDEMIRNAFKARPVRDAHDAMADNQDAIREIQKAFLNGDAEKIVAASARLKKDIRLAQASVDPDEAQQSAVWKAMAQISTDADGLAKDARAKQWQGAYAHYSRMVGQCIDCHQFTRAWGRLPEPEPEPEEPVKEAKTSVKTSKPSR